MSDEGSKLPKGLFGYRRAVVRQILEDRDIMVRSAEDRVRRSESRVQQLETELDSVKTQNGRLEAQLERFGEQLDSLSVRLEESNQMAAVSEPVTEETQEPPVVNGQPDSPGPSPASKLMAEELNSILMAGQDAAARMIERARDEAQRQIVEANRLLGEVHEGVRNFSSWREDVTPVVGRVQGLVDIVRGHIAQTPERVQHALAPMAEAMLAVDTELLELSGVCQSPFPESAQGLEARVEIPEAGTLDEADSDESIWLTVEEDQVTVSETSDDELPLEASAG
jgi:cell division septum initiation protein DivIVA